MAGGRHGDRELGQLPLGGVEPLAVATALLKQPVAIAQGPLQPVHPRSVVAIHRQHQTVEEAPAVARRAAEQAVHGRRQPDDPQVIGKGPRGANGRPLDPVASLGWVECTGRFEPGAELLANSIGLDLDGHRPAAGPADAGHLGKLRPAQAAPGCEHGQGLEDVCLPRPVIAGQHHELARHGQVQGGIGAEVRQDQPAHARKLARNAQGRVRLA